MTRLSPEFADAQLAAFLAEFERTNLPVHVSFRDILGVFSAKDRVTHDLHHYPGRLLVSIPSFFLSSSLSQTSEVVLDPFCGSGTVLLEAILVGRNATGADANPLARLITSAKLTPSSPAKLQLARSEFFQELHSAPQCHYPKVLNLEYWFHPHVRQDLLLLLGGINQIKDEATRNIFSVTFSACLKDVSLADPRLSVPVRLKENQYPEEHWLHERTNKRLRCLATIDVLQVFAKRLDDNIQRAEHLAAWPDLGQLLGLESDARKLTQLATESIDMVITSPPYLGAQKYIRASSLSLTWLSLCDALQLRKLEDQNIGREHYAKQSYAVLAHTGLQEADKLIETVRQSNPLRAHIAASYFREMREALREISRVLKPKRYLVLIAGASRVCGTLFPTPTLLAKIAEQEGLSLRLHLVDPIRTRALMTKRHHTAGKIDTESILLLTKDS